MIPPLLTWDLNSALAQRRAQLRQPSEPSDASEAVESVTAVVQSHGSPRSPCKGAASGIDGTFTEGGTPAEASAAAAASLPRRPSLGSVLRAVGLPCQPCGDDDPTVSPRSEPAGAAQAAARARRRHLLLWPSLDTLLDYISCTRAAAHLPCAGTGMAVTTGISVMCRTRGCDRECACVQQVAAVPSADPDRQPTFSSGSGFVHLVTDALGRLSRSAGGTGDVTAGDGASRQSEPDWIATARHSRGGSGNVEA